MDGKDKNLNKPPQNDSKIVAEFRIVDSPVESISAQEAFIEDYNSCPLCGTELNFMHVTHFVDQVVHEDASCDACNIKVKNDNHRLH